MKNAFYLLIIFFTQCFAATAQENVQALVDKKAYPKEGLQTFYKNFANELKLPILPKGRYEVVIRLKFIVEKDGSFSDIQVLEDNLDLSEEVGRTLNMMPHWNPAIYNEKYVRSSFTLPIKIQVKDPQQKTLKKKGEIKEFLKSLESNFIDTDYFELYCNCVMIKSSKNDELLSEEFMLQTIENNAFYNIAFRKMSLQEAEKELETIEIDAKKQHAKINRIKFNSSKAVEVFLDIPNENYVDSYSLLFFYHNNYLVVISIVSYQKQHSELLFKHLKTHFKLKI